MKELQIAFVRYVQPESWFSSHPGKNTIILPMSLLYEKEQRQQEAQLVDVAIRRSTETIVTQVVIIIAVDPSSQKSFPLLPFYG